MKYLLMCCFNEGEWDAIPQPERERIMQEYGAWIRDAAGSGHYLAGAKLCPSAAATTLRARSGRTALMDGPFAETKEQLGGYHLVECRDLDEALALASRIPTLRAGGTIEVRPVDYVAP
jgi:hypothetical protein